MTAKEIPWFRDFDKLLAAVVRRAEGDAKQAGKLIDAAANMASRDKALRGRLMKRISLDAVGEPTGPATINDVHCIMMSYEFEILMRDIAMTKTEAREIIGDRWPGINGPRSSKQVKRLVERGDLLRPDTIDK